MRKLNYKCPLEENITAAQVLLIPKQRTLPFSFLASLFFYWKAQLFSNLGETMAQGERRKCTGKPIWEYWQDWNIQYLHLPRFALHTRLIPPHFVGMLVAALANATVIDWFPPWPHQALVSVAGRFLYQPQPWDPLTRCHPSASPPKAALRSVRFFLWGAWSCGQWQ